LNKNNDDDNSLKQYVFAFLWTFGDSMATKPFDDTPRIVILCDTFSLCFGFSEANKSSEDENLFDAVQKIRSDIMEYQSIEEALQQKEKVKSIREKFYSPEIFPKMVAYIAKFLKN